MAFESQSRATTELNIGGRRHSCLEDVLNRRQCFIREVGPNAYGAVKTRLAAIVHGRSIPYEHLSFKTDNAW